MSASPAPAATVPGVGTGKFVLQYGEQEEGYRIVAPDGTMGEIFDYGDPAIIDYKGQLYMAFAISEEEEHEILESNVWLLVKQATTDEEVYFGEPAGEEGEEQEAAGATDDVTIEEEGEEGDDDSDGDDDDDDDGQDGEEGTD